MTDTKTVIDQFNEAFLLRAPDAEAVALQVLSVETIDKSAVDLAAVGPRFVEAIEPFLAGSPA